MAIYSVCNKPVQYIYLTTQHTSDIILIPLYYTRENILAIDLEQCSK